MRIEIGERFVGQHAAEAKRDAEFERRFARGRPLDKYDDPDHLYQAWRDMQDEEARRKESGAALRAYIHYWAGVKRLEILSHRQERCWRQCPTCLLCRCGKSELGRFYCVCSTGMKFLSPYRRVWLNNSIKAHALQNVWQVGVGYVPRDSEKYVQHASGLDGLVS